MYDSQKSRINATLKPCVNRQGKIIVVGCSESGRLWYTVRRGGFEQQDNATDLQNWENLQRVPLPDGSHEDTSVLLSEMNQEMNRLRLSMNRLNRQHSDTLSSNREIEGSGDNETQDETVVDDELAQ